MLAAMASLQAQELDFIKTDINHIDMNGDDWSCLTDELLNPATDLPDGKFNILHIGDSHIQADYGGCYNSNLATADVAASPHSSSLAQTSPTTTRSQPTHRPWNAAA